MVIGYLHESEEEVAKRKKGAQGIPTQSILECQKIMRFVAEAICLKKDDKYLAEQVFAAETARVMQGETCNWARLLEKAMLTQMVAVKEKGQKLYNCAPIWAELYDHVKGTAQEEAEGSQKREAKKAKIM